MTSTKESANSAAGGSDFDPFAAVFAPRKKIGQAHFGQYAPGGGKVYGYARVSTTDQRLDRQLDVLEAEGCERIFTDKLTGATTIRPGLHEMCYQLEPGDTVVVAHLSRLGRSAADIVTILGAFSTMGVTFRAIKENVDTSTSTGRIVLQFLSVISEIERENIVDATNRGLEAARKKGRKGGRKPVIDKEKADELYGYIFGLNWSHTKAAEKAEVSRRTLYRWLEEKRYSDENGLDDFYTKYGLRNE